MQNQQPLFDKTIHSWLSSAKPCGSGHLEIKDLMLAAQGKRQATVASHAQRFKDFFFEEGIWLLAKLPDATQILLPNLPRGSVYFTRPFSQPPCFDIFSLSFS
jgi:hypothetical protein